MAPLPQYFKNFFFFYILFISSLFASSFFDFADSQIHQQQHTIFLARRNLLEKSESQSEEYTPKKKKSLDQTKTTKPTSSKNQTKVIKPITSSSLSSKKNQTKLISPKSKTSSSKENVGASTPLTQVKLTKKLNSTKSSSSSSSSSSTSSAKTTKTTTSSSSSKTTSTSSSSSDLKNRTKKASTNPKKEITKSTSLSNTNTNTKNLNKQEKTQKQKIQSPPTWMKYQDEDNDDDFIAEFRDLPTKFHKTFNADLQRLSKTSKIYLSQANKEITQTYIKPYVGNKYASSVATAISFAFIVVPFLLVSLVFNRIKAYFSLQKLLIFIQIYLSIYFSILCLSCLITGLEPLRFFYATSQSTYVWLQVLQTLAYVFYLLMLLMYLILVFSTETGLGQKFLGLGQTFVGFAVGLHYYMTVFHRVVLHQPPKTNWKVHGVYATCFLVICLFAHAERRKKVYFEEGGEEGKQS